MKIIFNQFLYKINNLDKLLSILIFFFPFLLSISIFLADLFASITALIVITLFFLKENKKIFYPNQNPIILLFIILFFNFNKSFLFNIIRKSFYLLFFYFRYFLFVVGIFYLLKKYDFFINIFFYSLVFTFCIILFDTLFQFLTGSNVLGFPRGDDPTPYVTSFFHDEKKNLEVFG